MYVNARAFLDCSVHMTRHRSREINGLGSELICAKLTGLRIQPFKFRDFSFYFIGSMPLLRDGSDPPKVAARRGESFSCFSIHRCWLGLGQFDLAYLYLAGISISITMLDEDLLMDELITFQSGVTSRSKECLQNGTSTCC